MTKKFKKPMTAAEAMAILQSDPEWVRKAKERETRRKIIEAQLKAEERPILEELAAVGCKVDFISVLVNSSTSYPEAVPVLCKHLPLPYDPKIREAIARALTVREARGVAGGVILAELQRSPEQSPPALRWALANALTVTADPSLTEEIKKLLLDERFMDVHERLKLALKKSQKTVSPRAKP